MTHQSTSESIECTICFLTTIQYKASTLYYLVQATIHKRLPYTPTRLNHSHGHDPQTDFVVDTMILYYYNVRSALKQV